MNSPAPSGRHPAIPLCDLQAQHAPIAGEVREAIDEVISSQSFIMGRQVQELEDRIADYCHCRHAVSCSSGSDALLLSLMALDIGPKDEVITTPYTFFATAGAIARVGATPVFVDIEPRGFNIDPDKLTEAITSRTRAIIPVHLFGHPAEMNAILDVARVHALSVIEDAAQAIGATFQGQPVGSLGELGCFSFFPSKNLGCFGDGGMVVTNNCHLADKIRVLRTHGAEKKYIHKHVGGNFRLDTLQAAVLLVKLKYLDRWNAARRLRARRYREMMLADGLALDCHMPDELPNRTHVYNQFVIRTPARDRLLYQLRASDIGFAVYYPMPLHQQECFRYLGYSSDAFPESGCACRQTIALPMHPELRDEDQQLVVDAVKRVVVHRQHCR